MKLIIDTESQSLIRQNGRGQEQLPLYSPEAFELISEQWVRVGWNQKYPYTFSWLGVPIIQLPEDLMRVQEVIHRVKPDVIIETGVAHGGSLIFYATLCKVFDKGRVIGLDIEIRHQNQRAIQSHPLSPLITLIEGDSVDAQIVSRVQSLIRPEEKVLVILDSCHTKSHVRAELEAYNGMVTPGSYIVATDGIMRDLHDVPRGHSAWKHDHPTAAAEEFAKAHPEFILEQPVWPFNESPLHRNVTHWPGAWLRRVCNPGTFI